MAKFITQTEVKHVAYALSVAKRNGAKVYGAYRLSVHEYVISGDMLGGHGDFWYVDCITDTFRAATQKEYADATA